MMRLIMVVSADGYVARDEHDDMSWTGTADKKIFRILTGVGGICAVGSKTYAMMPSVLHGRALVCLSRKGLTLIDLHRLEKCPDIWLLGGQTVALEALRLGIISEVHLCVSAICLGKQGIKQQLRQYLIRPSMSTTLLGTTVEVYRGDGIRTDIMGVVPGPREED